MRIALLSDVHANFEALAKVDDDAVDQAVDAVWCLGDTVGYGPEPAACVQWLAEVIHDAEADGWVLGNHDAMLAGLVGAADLAATNPVPVKAIDLNRAALAVDGAADAFWRTHFTDARARPRRHTIDGVDYTLVHGEQTSGRFLYRYVLPWDTRFLQMESDALHAQQAATGRPQVQLYGHTHVPTLVRLVDGAPLTTPVEPYKTYPLADVTLVNPGSVGQPRDLDNRAAYAILDTMAHTVVFRRVVYDLGPTTRLLAERRYPPELARRLMIADTHGTATAEWVDHFKAMSARVGV